VTIFRPTNSGFPRASERASVMTEGDHSSAGCPNHEQRIVSDETSGAGTLELFEREAERDDRYRPTFPDLLIDDLLGPKPQDLDVVDVGCGTGIAYG
jgi:hypothetical protein